MSYVGDLDHEWCWDCDVPNVESHECDPDWVRFVACSDLGHPRDADEACSCGHRQPTIE